MMKIAFLRINMFGKQSGDALAPLVFAIIKALTPEDISIKFFDKSYSLLTTICLPMKKRPGNYLKL
jgi:hypothetical protein